MHKNSVMALSLGAALLVGAANAQTVGDDTLERIIDDHWAWTLEQSPLLATSLGVRDYDDRLSDNSLAAFDQRMSQMSAFVARLEALAQNALSADEKINAQLLLLDLKDDLAEGSFGGRYIIISGRGGPHRTITGLPDRLPFFTKADYESYVSRLGDAPRFLTNARQTLAKGVETGWVQACEPLDGAEEAIRFHIVESADDSVLMKPFNEKPSTISDRDWRRLKADAARTIEREVIPAIENFAEYYTTDYAPNCREEPGLSALPDGGAYYDHRARVYTTTDQTTDEIHNLGLREVARIRAEMQTVIDETGFEGDFKAFQEFLRTDPQFYAKTPEELMQRTALIAKKADGALTDLFTRYPRMPYTLKEVPPEIAPGTTTAYYEPPAGDGSRPGVYRVNTSKLETRPLYEIEALTLHEAVPGHHFQIALMQESELPNFRRYGFFTAFVEGWGLYAESLGLDTGFYQDPYSNFGRLSYEMWRACRLVVDTGLHAKGWSKQQAMDYMAEYTALSLHNIEAEVNRYISNGGQALAYKIGELKMQELRRRASDELGADFDLRRFHDALLENGAVPLSVLEDSINAWIAAEKAAR